MFLIFSQAKKFKEQVTKESMYCLNNSLESATWVFPPAVESRHTVGTIFILKYLTEIRQLFKIRLGARYQLKPVSVVL